MSDNHESSDASQTDRGRTGRPSSALNMRAPAELTALKTRAELRSQTTIIDVWTVELPIKAANDILISLKELIPTHDEVDLTHLRRFAKSSNLPLHLQPPHSRSNSSSSRSTLDSGRGSSQSRSRMRRRRGSIPTTMYLLICPTTAIALDELGKILRRLSPFKEEATEPKIGQSRVPAVAPLTAEEAQQWSLDYWPTIYRKSNPFGPHPALVARGEREIMSAPGVQSYFDMARAAGLAARARGLGIGVGCVVIERFSPTDAHVVAVAADARHCGLSDDAASSISGHATHNVAAHAVLRAIGMVARKRVRRSTRPPKALQRHATESDVHSTAHSTHSAGPHPVKHVSNAPESIETSLLDYPLTPMEEESFRGNDLVPDGYLCVGLEMYTTHEPCLMCSMAIVHSRFGRCVFGQSMPKSGGLNAEGGLGYGLFWRSELNWKMPCWRYGSRQITDEDEDEHEIVLGQDTQV